MVGTELHLKSIRSFALWRHHDSSIINKKVNPAAYLDHVGCSTSNARQTPQIDELAVEQRFRHFLAKSFKGRFDFFLASTRDRYRCTDRR